MSSDEKGDWKNELKACKTCGKQGHFDFCNKDCIEKYKEKDAENRTESIETSQKIAIRDNPLSDELKDGAFQKGIHWRKNKLEAIYRSRKAGISDEQILRELRLGGITIQKARELMRDSEELLGR